MGIRVESQDTTLRDLYLSAESAEKGTTYLNSDSELGPAMRQSPRLHFTDTQSPSILTFSSATLHPRRTPYPRSTPFDAPTADVGIKSPSLHPSPNRVEATVGNSIAAAERSQRRGAPELNTNRLAAEPEHRYHQQSQPPNSNLEADPKGYVPHSPMRMRGLRFPSPGHELPPTQTQRPFCGSAEMPAIATAGFEDGAGQQREAWGAWTEPVSR